MDQEVAAQKLGGATRFAFNRARLRGWPRCRQLRFRLQLAPYSNQHLLAHRDHAEPPEINPRAQFERLFAVDRARRESGQPRQARAVQEEHSRLRSADKITEGHARTDDGRKIDEHLYAVRESRALESVEAAAEERQSGRDPAIEKPAGIPIRLRGACALMFDLQWWRSRRDLTRISTLMLGARVAPGLPRDRRPDAHHPLTHHRAMRDDREGEERSIAIKMEQFAYFIAS